MNFQDFITDQAEFSDKAFGEGFRWKGIVAHIRSELDEIEAEPKDPKEWVDVILLALDGLRRLVGTSDRVVEEIVAKHTINKGRKWGPITDDDKPNFHVREAGE